MRRSALFATVVIAAGLLTAGCSPSTEAEQKTENANAAVCLGLKGLGATIEGLQTGVTGTGDVTVDQATEAINQIDAAYDDVQAQLSKLDTAVTDQVLTAQEQFNEAQMQIQDGLSGLDGDQKLSDVPAEELKAIDDLDSSYQEMNESLGCSDAAE